MARATAKPGDVPPLLGPSAEAQRLLAKMPLAKLVAAAEARGLELPRRRTRAQLANRLVLHAMQEHSEAGYRKTGNPFDSRASAYLPIAQIVKRRRLRRLVDIGCGPGLFASVLRERDVLGPDGSYVGIDLSPAAVELARTRLSGDPRFSFHAADVSQLDAHLDADLDGIVIGFVMTLLDTHAVHRLFVTLARACPRATVIVASTFTSAVDRLDGVTADEPAELRAARRYLRGDTKVAQRLWDVTRLGHYRRSFEARYTIADEKVLPALAQMIWTGQPRRR